MDVSRAQPAKGELSTLLQTRPPLVVINPHTRPDPTPPLSKQAPKEAPHSMKEYQSYLSQNLVAHSSATVTHHQATSQHSEVGSYDVVSDQPLAGSNDKPKYQTQAVSCDRACHQPQDNSDDRASDQTKTHDQPIPLTQCTRPKRKYSALDDIQCVFIFKFSFHKS